VDEFRTEAEVIPQRPIRDRTSRVASILAFILAVVPAPARAQKAAADPWLGKRVIQRYNNFPLRNDGQAVLRSGMEIHIYRVERTDGDQLWLEGEDDGPRGWASADQFVRVEDAIAYLADRIRAHSEDGFLYALRAAIHIDRKKFNLAVDDWNKIVELEPDDAASYIGRAKLWAGQMEWDKAISDLTLAIKAEPKDAYCYRIRAHAWVAKRDYDKAIADYNEAIRLDPEDAEFYYDRAWVWQQKGNIARALDDFAAAVERDPELAWPRAEPDAPPAGTVDQKKAVDDFLLTLPLQHAATDVSPKDPAPKNKEAGVVPASFDPVPAPEHNDQHVTADAKAECRASGADAPAPLSRDTFGIVEPQTAREFASRAGDWLQVKMYDKAIADCNQAIDLGCHDPIARIYRGLAWSEKKEYDKAIADYTEVIRLDPQNAFTYFARASAWGAKQDYAKADADLGEALRLDPKNPVTCNGRAWTWATCPDAKYRDGQKAVELATKACELTDWNEAGVIDTLAAAYAEMGDFAPALKWQNRAIELETDAKNKVEFVARLKLYQEKKAYRDTMPR
jgi:tetratricopeptide (TPR) repeat protein